MTQSRDLDEHWRWGQWGRGQALSRPQAGQERESGGSQELGRRHLFLFSEEGHTGACRQVGSSCGELGADILLVAWLGAGFQQGVPGACLLPILGLAGLGVGDPEAGVNAALHVVLRILWGEGWRVRPGCLPTLPAPLPPAHLSTCSLLVLDQSCLGDSAMMGMVCNLHVRLPSPSARASAGEEQTFPFHLTLAQI